MSTFQKCIFLLSLKPRILFELDRSKCGLSNERSLLIVQHNSLYNDCTIVEYLNRLILENWDSIKIIDIWRNMKKSNIQGESNIGAIETPALILNLPVAKENMRRMFEFLGEKGIGLRPHVKVFRATPELALMQMEAGAVGMTCAKVSEAEVLAQAGITDILIANEIVGAHKINRLVNLAKDADIKVAVDNAVNVNEISQAATSAGITIGLLVEINIGHNRCGVAPFRPVLELTRHIHSKSGVRFMGLMGYDGHCTLKIDEAQRSPLSKKANKLLADNRYYIEDHGFTVQIVTGSGTFTYRFAADVAGLTEIQAGTYLLMDTEFQEHGIREFDCALSVLTEVISKPCYPDATRMVITDTGRKSLNDTYGNPIVKFPSGAVVKGLSDEHARIIINDGLDVPNIGDLIEIWVRDANGTINQFDKFYVIENEHLIDVWKIPLCGNHT